MSMPIDKKKEAKLPKRRIKEGEGESPTKKGQRVVMWQSYFGDDSRDNPVWGGSQGYVIGTVLDDDCTSVKWDTGNTNGGYYGHLYTVESLLAKSGKARKDKKVDLKQLDKLIIKKDTKDEIAAVLNQHNHAHIIFDKWGLGDVIEYGRGMTFLFHGPPGTGKTYGAHCMAKALGAELLQLGAAEVQSSEPGAAQRSIQNAFREAKSSGKVLFIDECDSLITDRAELGMVLASEVNTLLTEIEQFEGVLILATNRIGRLDEALERRISLIVEFPMPDYEARVGIWKLMLPKKMPIETGVSAESLAEMALSGGQIKNVVLNAARLCLSEGKKKVDQEHFDKATKRVLKGVGLLGKTSPWRQFEDFQAGKGPTVFSNSEPSLSASGSHGSEKTRTKVTKESKLKSFIEADMKELGSYDDEQK